MGTPTAFVSKTLDQSPLTEFLLSACVFLSWMRHVPPWVLQPFCSLCPLLFDMSVFGIPSFQATGTGQVYCPFLGKHPVRGVGPASQEVQAVLVCTEPQGPGVCQAECASWCVRYFWGDDMPSERSPEIPILPLSPWNANLPSSCQVYKELSTSPALWPTPPPTTWQETSLQEIRATASLRTLELTGKASLVVTGSEAGPRSAQKRRGL